MIDVFLACVSAILEAAMSAQVAYDAIVLATIGIAMFVACAGTVTFLGLEWIHKKIAKSSGRILRKVTSSILSMSNKENTHKCGTESMAWV